MWLYKKEGWWYAVYGGMVIKGRILDNVISTAVSWIGIYREGLSAK